MGIDKDMKVINTNLIDFLYFTHKNFTLQGGCIMCRHFVRLIANFY